jgi:PAS domain S-box-containing protein
MSNHMDGGEAVINNGHAAAAGERRFADCGGSVGQRIDAFGWGETDLGPIGAWPAPMRSTVEMVLRAPLPMLSLWGPHGVMLYNDAYADLLDEHHPALLGAPACIGAAGLARFHGQIVQEVLAGGALSLRGQALPLRQAGRPGPSWFDVDASAIVGDQGVVIGAIAIVRDASARVLAERELAASQARLRGLSQAVPQHVWIADVQGRMEWFNERTYEYSGYGFDELAGEGWGRAVHPGDLQTLRSKWSDSLATGAVFEAEVRLLRADGTYRWHLNRAVPLREADGQVSGWIGTDTDIEEHKTMAQQYARLERDLQGQVALRAAERERIWRLSNDIFLVCGFDGRIEAVNPAFQALLGWSDIEVLGKNFLEFMHPEDRRVAVALMARLGNGEHVTGTENRYRRKQGGWCPLAWTAVVEERCVYAVGRDISVEREASAAIERDAQVRQRAQAMDTMGRLAGNAGHAFAALCLRVAERFEAPGSETIGAQARAAAAESARLAGCLLAFGRRQLLAPQVVDPGRLAAAFQGVLQGALGERIELKLAIAEALWLTAVDVDRLEEALLHVADNARDAIEGSGCVTIEVANTDLDAAYCRAHGDLTPGQYVMLSISDDGCGMAPEVCGRAVEPFFSTKPASQAAGLGLSVVYGFARQSGGNMTLDSAPGKGTRVRMHLPRSLAAEGSFPRA